MYFKIEDKTSPAGIAAWDLRTKMDAAYKAAKKLATDVGADSWLTPTNVVYGGITGFDKLFAGDTKLYKKAGKQEGTQFYFPRSVPANKALLERIAALPTVKVKDINSVLNYEPQTIGNKHYFSPAISYRKKVALVKTQEAVKYKPIEGMVEITQSEYDNLLKTSEKI